ncbi:putative Methyltransferase FkbM family [Syntrophobacter sp. SbD1]|nr:putative Methyltransferase FkbM family [Syntrophobacter sp. SbD1]
MIGAFKQRLSRLFAQDAFPHDAFYIDKAFQGRKIIVYGAGESFHYFKEVVMRRYGYTPSAVLDRRFGRDDIFEGIPAFSPLEYQPSEDEKQSGVVVVCLGKQRYFDEVFQTLRNMGFHHIISLMDIYEIHNPFSLPRELEGNGFQYYLKQRQQIESCLDILADDSSRDVYLQCLQTHMQRKPVAIPMCAREEQYTPKGIQLSRGYSRFIYCGVSVGEMSGVFSRVGKVDELVCFEPDPNQFALTAQYLSEHHEQIAQRVTAIPCAVYSHETTMPFSYSDTSFGSRILESGGARIQCVSIDHVLHGFDPTFINMDIEGAELEALKGAEKTIRTSRPDLGICVYHSPSHLWEIPLHLHNLNVGYHLHLRNYTALTGETVLYASTCPLLS